MAIPPSPGALPSTCLPGEMHHTLSLQSSCCNAGEFSLSLSGLVNVQMGMLEWVRGEGLFKWSQECGNVRRKVGTQDVDAVKSRGNVRMRRLKHGRDGCHLTAPLCVSIEVSRRPCGCVAALVDTAFSRRLHICLVVLPNVN